MRILLGSQSNLIVAEGTNPDVEALLLSRCWRVGTARFPSTKSESATEI